MKILYHHRTLSKDGQDVHIREMIAALIARGHEVILVAPVTSRDGQDAASDGASRLRQILPRAVAELLELGYSIPAYLRLLKAWRKHRPDILYERCNLFLLSGSWLKAHTGIPMLLEVNAPLYEERRLHGGLAWPALARWTERHVWRRSDAILPVTAVLTKHLTAAGIPDRRIHVIANGVDTQRFSASSRGESVRRELGLEGKLILGFTGFIRPWHGLVRVVEAMAQLPDHPALHLLVIGDGPGRAAIEERARALGMTDRVTMRGVVDRGKIAAYIAAFDIALQPHAVAYASPLKLFEYMALGRAIIAPDQLNIREVLHHERDALLFDRADAGSFSSAITRLCIDSALRTKLGEGAKRTLAQGRYSWAENAVRVEAIARTLLEASPGNSARRSRAMLSTIDQ